MEDMKSVLYYYTPLWQTSMKPHSMISKSYGSPDSSGGKRASKTLQNCVTIFKFDWKIIVFNGGPCCVPSTPSITNSIVDGTKRS